MISKKWRKIMEKKVKQYNSRKEWMKCEFDLSEEEINGLDIFLSGKETGLVSEFLRSVISTDVLNNKQKVILSYMMGRFVEEQVKEEMKLIERSIIDINKQSSVFGG